MEWGWRDGVKRTHGQGYSVAMTGQGQGGVQEGKGNGKSTMKKEVICLYIVRANLRAF